MERKCEKCKKKITSDDFICPHCGMIVGDPVSYARTVPEDKRISRRRLLAGLICAAFLVVLLAVGVTVLVQWQQEQAASVPSDTLTAPDQTTGPLTVYTVQIEAADQTDLTRSCIHVYSGEQELCSSQVGKNGTATFILPESDGYTVTLTDMPVQFQINYGEAVFTFEEGQQKLSITLENKPVPYTVKVVNSAGEPLAGTGIAFYTRRQDAEKGVTDENGCCTFEAEYQPETTYASAFYAPNGYYADDTIVRFGINSLEATMVLGTYEEAGIAKDSIYTVKVIDEFGDPVPNIYLQATFHLNSGAVGARDGYTNMEGCFTVITNSVEVSDFCVNIPQDPDNFDKLFYFEEGSRELVIPIVVHTLPSEFLYTVHIVDQFSRPVAGVEIAYTVQDTGEIQYYTSDENGVITFPTVFYDPAEVLFCINSLPEGYTTYLPDYAQYSFPYYRRTMTIELSYEGMMDYTVTVIDTEGNPIAGAKIELYGSSVSRYAYTDDNGCCVFTMPAGYWYDADILSLPGDYTYFWIEDIWTNSNFDWSVMTFTVNWTDRDVEMPAV